MAQNALSVTLASGEALDVREFTVHEGLSRLFEVSLVAVSPSVDVDFEGAIGQEARFEIDRRSAVDGDTRYWSGLCAGIEQVGVEESGLSTYSVRIVPRMWLLTQRRNYKVFQDKSELDVALEVLSGWGIAPVLHLSAASYGKRRMRVQYAESDFDFVSRLLEDIGVTYYFEQQGGATVLVLSDCPNKGPVRAPVEFVDKPNERVAIEWVTAVRSGRYVRPGRYTQSDVDYRKPLDFPLASSASRGNGVEASLERYHHNYGSFLWKAEGGGDTPHADDRGAARTSEGRGAEQVQKRLDAQRVEARQCSFQTIAHDLRPGKVFTIAGHPRSELSSPLLVVSSAFSGVAFGDWVHTCETRFTDVDYRPELRTSKPRVRGVESATVTGPAGEEIHTDEFGRVRVRFHWDREGASDETSSCWVPLSQPWAGAGFGNISLARVGQEVLVGFLGADPDRPVVIGRVYTTTNPPPYPLPKYKMVSGHRSESYPRPKGAPPQARLGGGPPEAPAGGGLPLGSLGAADGFPPVGASPSPAADGLGPFGGMPLSSGDLDTTARSTTGVSPTGTCHTLSANGLVHDDTNGNELLYLQANRNLHSVVKANSVSTVGANNVCTVAKNQTSTIGAYEYHTVVADRTVTVGGSQTVQVNGEKAVLATPTGSQGFVAQVAIALSAGGESGSTILMTPTAIVIDAKHTYINPGPEVMADIAKGKSPEDAVAAAEKRARINKGAKALASAVKQMHMDQSPGGRKTVSDVANGTPGPDNGAARILRENGVTDPGEQAAAAQQADKMLGPIDPQKALPW